MPEEVQLEELENNVIKIFNETKVSAHGCSLEHFDMEVCHIIGKEKCCKYKMC